MLSDCPGVEIYEEANFNPDVSAFRIEVTNTRPSLMKEFFGYVQFSTAPDSLTTVRLGNQELLICQLIFQFSERSDLPSDESEDCVWLQG